MSTPETIADLIDGNTDLLQAHLDDKAARDADLVAWQTSINTQIANAAAASSKTLVVDAVLGDDVNPGNSAGPLRTIQEAIDRVPAGGFTKVTLRGDYLIDTMIDLRGGTLFILGEDSANRSVITFAEADVDDPAASRTPGFAGRDGGSINFLRFQHVVLRAADNPATSTGDGRAMIHTIGPTFVRMLGCEIVLPAGSNQYVFSRLGMATFDVTDVLLPANMPGRWMIGVPAGTDPLTLDMVHTNLTSL